MALHLEAGGGTQRGDVLQILREFVLHPAYTARLIARRIKDIPLKGLPRLRRQAADEFDRRYGVETASVVHVTAPHSPNVRHGNRYEAASEAPIHWGIKNCGLPLDKTTFVDVGCGKGRVLIIAAAYPFKAIHGIEYAPELVRICKGNLNKVGAGGRCEVVEGDAVDYVFPDGDLLAFVYNPFGESVHRRVLDNLSRSTGRVRVVHLGPGQDVVRRSGLAHDLATGPDGVRLFEMI